MLSLFGIAQQEFEEIASIVSGIRTTQTIKIELTWASQTTLSNGHIQFRWTGQKLALGGKGVPEFGMSNGTFVAELW